MSFARNVNDWKYVRIKNATPFSTVLAGTQFDGAEEVVAGNGNAVSSCLDLTRWVDEIYVRDRMADCSTLIRSTIELGLVAAEIVPVPVVLCVLEVLDLFAH